MGALSIYYRTVQGRVESSQRAKGEQELKVDGITRGGERVQRNFLDSENGKYKGPYTSSTRLLIS